MAERTEDEQLNQEIFNAFAELISRFLAQGQQLADRYEVPSFAVKALHWLDGGMAMKDLGRLLRCDPSFVTAIADALEKRGLGRREPNPADRRIKNLVLTEEGRDLKDRLEREMVASMPWCHALTVDERKTLLALIRKLAVAAAPAAPQACTHAPQLLGAGTGEEVSG